MRLQTWTVSLLLFSGGAAFAENSNLQKAVNFVLTNNEDGQTFTPIDENKCIFGRDGGGRVYLNKIYINSIDWNQKNTNIADRYKGPIYAVSVLLHLEGKQFLEWGSGDADFNFGSLAILGKGGYTRSWGSGGQPVDIADVTVMQPQVASGGRQLQSLDLQRHRRAWEYIYGPGGCTPLHHETPF